MSTFSPVPGCTFLWPSGTPQLPDTNHLAIILTHPHSYSEYLDAMLFVTVSTIYAGKPYDSTCILRVGDHPFLRQDSYVAYNFCNFITVPMAEAKLLQGKIHMKPNLSGSVLSKVQTGLGQTSQIKGKYLNFFNAYAGI